VTGVFTLKAHPLLKSVQARLIRYAARPVIESANLKLFRREMMKKIILSAVMVLALAGGSVFAGTAQNSNSGSKSTSMKSGKKRVKHHKRAKHTTMKKANSNS
jgi:hypothetical protein